MPRGSFPSSRGRIFKTTSLDSVDRTEMVNEVNMEITSLGSSANTDSVNLPLKKTIRTNFPETWLFQLDVSK